MASPVLATSTGATGIGVASITTPSFTVLAGDVLTAITTTAGEGVTTVTSITEDGGGGALTAIQALVNDSSSGVFAATGAYGHASPTTGSRTITANFSATLSGGGGVVYAGAWSSANTTSFADAFGAGFHAGDGGGGAGADVTVTDALNGDVVVSTIASFSATVTATATLIRVDNDLFGGSQDQGWQYTTAIGSTVMTWTGDGFCTHVAFAIRQSAAPPNMIYRQLPITIFPGRRA